MQYAHQFEEIHDSQVLFRRLLHGMSHPMEAQSFYDIATRVPGEMREELCLAMTLLDNESTFYCEDEALHHAITLYTRSVFTPPERADFIFFSADDRRIQIETLMKHCRKGSHADPEQSATLICSHTALAEGSPTVSLEGPGVKGTRLCALSSALTQVCLMAREVDCEYPCGFDLIFLGRDSSLRALPRTTMVKEVS